MKALQLMGPKRFEILEVETPTPKEGECLVRMEKVSICGSDIRHGYGTIYPEEDYPLDVGRPCHECAGVVVDSHTDQIREGQRVIALPAAGTGGLVEYLTSSPERLIPLPDEGDLTDWVMCQPTGTVLYSCQRLGSVLGENVLIIGQGAIGLSFTMLASRLGASRVIAADLLDYRLEYSRMFGATHTINPEREDLAEAVKEITGGEGPDVTVEAAGYPDTLNLAFSVVRQFGRVVLFGIQSNYVVPVNTRLWLDLQPTIISTSSNRTPDPTSAIRDLVALRERGWIDPAAMITHRMGFSAEEVNRAFDMYERREDNIVKVVISV